MSKTPDSKPHYPLRDVKELIKEGKVDIRDNALMDAWDDFGWRINEIKKCILKFNDKHHLKDRKNNHFYKTEIHRKIPNTMMDYYKAVDVMEGCNVYTHFYIHPDFGNLVISSFKELL